MRIDSYSFGKIVIDGTTYRSDVIIYPDRVDAPWWRKQGHLLQIEDLAEVLEARPEILVIGTGYSGIMRVPHELLRLIEGKGIMVRAERTSKAAEVYNEREPGKIAIAALHITC